MHQAPGLTTLPRPQAMALVLAALGLAVALRVGLSLALPAAWGQVAYLPAGLLAGLAGGWPGAVAALLLLLADLAWGLPPAPGSANAVLLLAGVASLALAGLGLRHAARRQQAEARRQLQELEQRGLEQQGPEAGEQAAEASLQHETLRRELSHRVKNNFQLVASLLRLQARRAGNEVASAILNTTILRIQSMSALQESLYRNRDIGHIDLRHYLGEVCTRLAEAQVDGRDIRLAFEAEAAELPGEYALPLGLAVSELVSNALRHAFPPGSHGTVQVSLRRQGETMCLAVEDDGPALQDIETVQSRGFGMLLVASCASQMEGELRISASPTRFELHFPVNLAA